MREKLTGRRDGEYLSPPWRVFPLLLRKKNGKKIRRTLSDSDDGPTGDGPRTTAERDSRERE